MGRKDATMGANRFGLHRSLCGFAADRDRRPPFRALSVSQESHPSPRRGVLFSVAVEGLPFGLHALFSALSSLGRHSRPIFVENTRGPIKKTLQKGLYLIS